MSGPMWSVSQGLEYFSDASDYGFASQRAIVKDHTFALFNFGTLPLVQICLISTI